MEKYLLVLSTLEFGGAEKQAINFAMYLQKMGRDVEIIGLSKPGYVNKVCEDANLPCHALYKENKFIFIVLEIINLFTSKFFKMHLWGRGIALMFALTKFIKRNKFNICISYCAYANTILGMASLFDSKGKYVWFQRDAGIQNVSEGYQKKAIHSMDYVLSNSISGSKWIKETYGLDSTIIPNGVTIKKPVRTEKEWYKKLGVDDSYEICTMVANLSSAKDHMILLRTWKRLAELNKCSHLLLVFAGRFDDQYQKLHRYATENNLLDSIRFLGQVEDVVGLLRVSSICIFGAISEGSPNSIIEAALCGLPVVATNLPEIQEIVSEKNREFLFEKGNVDSVIDKLICIMNNREMREEIGKENKCKAEKMFSEEVNFSRIIDLLEKKGKR